MPFDGHSACVSSLVTTQNPKGYGERYVDVETLNVVLKPTMHLMNIRILIFTLKKYLINMSGYVRWTYNAVRRPGKAKIGGDGIDCGLKNDASSRREALQ
jgi:hypothetical protein